MYFTGTNCNSVLLESYLMVTHFRSSLFTEQILRKRLLKYVVSLRVDLALEM